MTSLHINIDHVATLRQARKTIEPSPLEALKILESSGVAGITIHLREDRRHINDADVAEIDGYLRSSRSPLLLTFEMGATEEIRALCLSSCAHLATIVPESRAELTTEGGMDLVARFDYLQEFIKPIQAQGIPISFFVDPLKEQVLAAHQLGAEYIELHTGTYANLFLQNSEPSVYAEYSRLQEAALYAQSLGLKTNLGHGLTLPNLAPLLRIPNISELHIGHSIIANSIYDGLGVVVERFLGLINASASS